MAAETKTAVIAALVGNGLITASKFVVGLLTGSVSMLSEAAHSLGDTFNQVFLLVGINLGNRPPDSEHPFGHGKERFFWTFVTALALFFVGAFFSIYEGATLIIEVIKKEAHRESVSLTAAYATLAFAVVFESGSLAIAIREVAKGAKAKSKAIIPFLRDSEDTTIKTVLFEDSAAMIGLLLAFLGIWLAETTGNLIFDGIASVMIGIVLVAVAVFLAHESRKLLLGQVATPQKVDELRQVIRAHPKVQGVGEIMTMYLGPDKLLVNASVCFSDSQHLERSISDVEAQIRASSPEISNLYIKPVAHAIIFPPD